MKIQFPLWLVTNPGPKSEMADVCTELPDFEYAERVIAGLRHLGKSPSTRSPALYTDEAEATADAQARLAARDAADRAKWIPLIDLRCGAVFETQSGVKGTKIAWLADGRVDWIGTDGSRPFTSGDILVREIKV